MQNYNILIYGDSNAWGYIPNANGYSAKAIDMRYDLKLCWCNKLKDINGVNLFVDGKCGRSINNDNRWRMDTNATQTLLDDLRQQRIKKWQQKYGKFDLVIIQLGTNDCKTEYDLSAEKIVKQMEMFALIMQQTTKADIMLIAPPKIIEDKNITKKYYQGGAIKTTQLEKLYSQIAKKNDWHFVSAFDCDIGADGEHLTPLGHCQLAEKVKNQLHTIIPQQDVCVKSEK